MTFLETSALTGENVEEVFLKTARSILAKIEAGTRVLTLLGAQVMDMFFTSQESWIRREWGQVFNSGTGH